MEDNSSTPQHEHSVIADNEVDEECLVGDDETEPVEVQQSSKKSGSTKSTIWDHFSKIQNGETAKCKYCTKSYYRSKKHGTSSLWTHLHSCKNYLATKIDEKQKTLVQSTIPKSGSDLAGCKMIAVSSFNKEAIRKALVRMVVTDELPFSFVEGEGFKYFCSVACPRFEIPSRITIARDIIKLYMEERVKLQNLFKQNGKKVCLAIDTWTSIQNMNYMVVTAHFIDDNWQLHKRILNFCPISNHKGEMIGKLIESCLVDWGIERVFTITADNASANDVALNYVKKKLQSWENNVLTLKGDFMHVRCCAHILNLIVSDGLKELHSSISSIRNAVRYVRSSPARLLKFKLCVELEKIVEKGSVIMDVPTRWNSTYLMLESALKFQKAFDRMAEEDGGYVMHFMEHDGKKLDGPPKFEDWENAQVFLQFLKTFYDATLKFSTSLNVSSNIHFHQVCKIQTKLNSLINDENSFMNKMASQMKKKFDKYWGHIDNINQLLILAVVLDPRYKLDYVRFCFGTLYGDVDLVDMLTSRIKDLLVKLYECYSGVGIRGSGVGVSIGYKVSDVGLNGEVDDNDFETKYRRLKESNTSIEGKNEVERYLLDPNEGLGSDSFDILLWWKLNSFKYKNLGEIARDVFAIPVSTVALESAFSTEGRVLDAFRSSLTPKMVEALICTQNWVRSSPLPTISTKHEQMMKDIEFYDKLDAEITIPSRLNHLTLD